MTITILFNGQDFGPFSKEKAVALVRDGTLSGASLARQGETEEWRPLSEVLAGEEIGFCEKKTNSAIPPPPPKPRPKGLRPGFCIALILVLCLLYSIAYDLRPATDSFPLGDWLQEDDQVRYSFKADGTYTMGRAGIFFTGTWKERGNTLILRSDRTRIAVYYGGSRISQAQYRVHLLDSTGTPRVSLPMLTNRPSA